jgi:C-terminal processing protease CtpA/Prc
MRTLPIVLITLMLGVPQALMAQTEEDAQAAAEERVEHEALRAELEEARREVAEAAQKMARIQRELADTKAFDIRAERLEALESLEGDLAGMEERIHREVIRGLRLTRPRLGVLLGDDASEITGVTPGSGADKAGIEAGDRLISINGEVVDGKNPETLRAPMEGLEPGDMVPVEIERDGSRMTFDVELSSPARDFRVVTHNIYGPPHAPGAPDAPAIDREVIVIEGQGHRSPAPPLPRRLAGLGRHSNMISNHAGLEPYFGTAEGVLVLRIDTDNPLQLQDGDVVLSIDGESVSRPVEIGRALLGQGGETVRLEVMRDGERITIEADLPEPKSVSALMQTLLPGF